MNLNNFEQGFIYTHLQSAPHSRAEGTYKHLKKDNMMVNDTMGRVSIMCFPLYFRPPALLIVVVLYNSRVLQMRELSRLSSSPLLFFTARFCPTPSLITIAVWHGSSWVMVNHQLCEPSEIEHLRFLLRVRRFNIEMGIVPNISRIIHLPQGCE